MQTKDICNALFNSTADAFKGFFIGASAGMVCATVGASVLHSAGDENHDKSYSMITSTMGNAIIGTGCGAIYGLTKNCSFFKAPNVDRNNCSSLRNFSLFFALILIATGVNVLGGVIGNEISNHMHSDSKDNGIIAEDVLVGASIVYGGTTGFFLICVLAAYIYSLISSSCNNSGEHRPLIINP